MDTLCQWQKSRRSIDLIVGQAVAPLKDFRDRQLVKAIIFGVLRNYSLLDWVAAKYSRQPLQKMKMEVMQALRVGIYQLLFMDRVPASAAVNETIKALKAHKQPRWITGFANGVLRNVERQKSDLLAVVNSGKIPERARLNHPDWLLHRWKKRYGSARLEEICRANNTQAGLCLRVNSARISVEDFLALLTNEGIAYSQGKYQPEAVWIDAETGLVENLPGYSEGYFWVQDELAQLLCSLLGPFEEGAYVDGCAGLGGKTAVIEQCIPPGSTITAVEPTRQRLELLGRNFARLGVTGVDIYQGTLQEFARDTMEIFRAVLVDAPCSGLGVIGRHPDIRWSRKPEDLKRYPEKQLELLQAAAGLVGPGGVVVYATCSTEPEENEQVVEQFLSSNSKFTVEDARNVLGEKCNELVDEKGFLRTVPGDLVSDGFFAARLVNGSG